MRKSDFFKMSIISLSLICLAGCEHISESKLTSTTESSVQGIQVVADGTVDNAHEMDSKKDLPKTFTQFIDLLGNADGNVINTVGEGAPFETDGCMISREYVIYVNKKNTAEIVGFDTDNIVNSVQFVFKEGKLNYWSEFLAKYFDGDFKLTSYGDTSYYKWECDNYVYTLSEFEKDIQLLVEKSDK